MRQFYNQGMKFAKLSMVCFWFSLCFAFPVVIPLLVDLRSEI